MGSAKSEGTKPKLHNLADVRNVRTEAIVAALYNLEPSCRRRGGACTAERAHKTPRPSGWRLLRLKTGASSLHYSLMKKWLKQQTWVF